MQARSPASGLELRAADVMCPMNIEFSYIDGGKHPFLGQVLHLSINPINGDKRYLNFLCNPLSMVIKTIEDCETLA